MAGIVGGALFLVSVTDFSDVRVGLVLTKLLVVVWADLAVRLLRLRHSRADVDNDIRERRRMAGCRRLLWADEPGVSRQNIISLEKGRLGDGRTGREARPPLNRLSGYRGLEII